MYATVKKLWPGEDEPHTIIGPDGIFIECVVDRPPSMKGRTVHLYCDNSMVTALMLELRAQAIRARQKAMTQ